MEKNQTRQEVEDDYVLLKKIWLLDQLFYGKLLRRRTVMINPTEK